MRSGAWSVRRRGSLVGDRRIRGGGGRTPEHAGRRLARSRVLGGPAFDIDASSTSCTTSTSASRLGPSTWAIVEEARRRGIPGSPPQLSSLVQLGLGRNLRRIQATLTDHTSAIGVEIAQDKDDTKRVLGGIGLPVPKGARRATAEGRRDSRRRSGIRSCSSRSSESRSRHLAADHREAAVRAAWEASSTYRSRIIVEQFAEGRDHRVLVISGKVVAVAERVPAHVIGRWTQVGRELIEIGNRDHAARRRSHKECSRSCRMRRDDDRVSCARRAADLISVPAKGEFVALWATANLSTGGTSIDRTDEMHPNNVTACEMAAGVVGLDIAGIDVLTPDISVPFRENGAAIIEVNAAPGVRMHTHPTEGEPRNIGAPIIDMLYPPGATTTIPVIAVTGTNGKTTTTRLIAHIFRQGENVGIHHHRRGLPRQPARHRRRHDRAVLREHHPVESDGGRRRARDCARRDSSRRARLR